MRSIFLPLPHSSLYSKWTLFLVCCVSLFCIAAYKLSNVSPLQATAAVIANSTRFNGTNGYLNTVLANSNRDLWTHSFWVKRGSLSSLQTIFSCNSPTDDRIYFNATDNFVVNINGTDRLISTAVFRDPSAWQHIVVAYDAANATASLRLRVYVNGLEITSWSTDSRAGITTGTANTNRANQHHLGRRHSSANNYFSGYMSDVYFVDGQALDATSFGETNSTNNNWDPIAYAGAYGTNGYHLDFAIAATPGTDVSGLNNDYTANNIATTDNVVDTPSNNFATLNSVDSPAQTLSSGNLSGTGSATAVRHSRATIGVSSGKWYWECTPTASVASNPNCGVATPDTTWSAMTPTGTATGYRADGQKTVDGTLSAYGATYVAADTIGVALDVDSGKVTFYKNNVSQGVLSIPTNKTWVPYWMSAAAANLVILNFGQGGQAGLTYDGASDGYFKYTPPSGYKALSTANLPAPTITKPGIHFQAGTYTGTGATRTFGTFYFAPAFVWLKDRTTAQNHGLFNSTSGATKYLSSNTTAGETTSATTLTSFLSTGFLLGTNALFNTNTNNYIGYLWKESSDNGFDIVTYTGNGANRTISHSLASNPEMMMVKRLNAATNWAVYHADMTSPCTQYMSLNLNAAATTDATVWNSGCSFSDTVLLLHGDGTDASTTFIDSSDSNHSVTAVGNAQIDTSQSKFGGASIQLDGTGDYVTAPNSNAFEFGTDDFTWEMWVRFGSLAGNMCLISFNDNSGDQVLLLWETTNQLNVFLGGAADITPWTPVINTWYHVAVARQSGTIRVFIDGVLLGTHAAANVADTAGDPMQVGSHGGGSFLNGRIDDVRVTKGLARYTAAFTPPTAAFDTNSDSRYVSLGTSSLVNTNAATYIAYLFKAIPGFSSIGKYTGNGSADGVFVYTGFKPALVVLKDKGTTDGWFTRDYARDTNNPVSTYTALNSTAADVTAAGHVDFLSNGFKHREVAGFGNGGGSSYVYYAYAETPFKYARAQSEWTSNPFTEGIISLGGGFGNMLTEF